MSAKVAILFLTMACAFVWLGVVLEWLHNSWGMPLFIVSGPLGVIGGLAAFQDLRKVR